jgi:hypothetical protein
VIFLTSYGLFDEDAGEYKIVPEQVAQVDEDGKVHQMTYFAVANYVDDDAKHPGYWYIVSEDDFDNWMKILNTPGSVGNFRMDGGRWVDKNGSWKESLEEMFGEEDGGYVYGYYYGNYASVMGMLDLPEMTEAQGPQVIDAFIGYIKAMGMPAPYTRDFYVCFYSNIGFMGVTGVLDVANITDVKPENMVEMLGVDEINDAFNEFVPMLFEKFKWVPDN